MLPTTHELLKKSFTLYKQNKKDLLTFTGVLAIPLLITALYRLLFSFTFNPNIPYIKLITPAIILFILYLFTLWGTITLIRVLSAFYNRSKVNSVGKELHTSIPLVVPALITIVLMAFAVIGGLFFFIIPGIIFSIWFFFSVYSVILDGKHGTAALHFSKKLTQGKWWDILWLIFSSTFLILVSTLLVQTALHFIFTLLTQLSGEGTMLTKILSWTGVLISFLVNVLVLPLSAAVPTILYNDLKKAKNL